MKKAVSPLLSLVGVFFLLTLQLNAQQTKTLNQPESGNKTHVARDEINFNPGYEYSHSNKMEAYLNKNIIGSPSYTNFWNNTSFNARDIDESLPVGYTMGVSDVSPTGASTFSIPIAVPQGTNGMTPNVAINYNSQTAGGLLGVGWNLASHSVISRTPKTHYHNDKVQAVQFDNSDGFSLDGNRLIPVSGGNGNSGTTYKTELETFSRITSYGNISGGPEWFKVETADGKTIEYGRVSNARFTSGQGKVMLWCIHKMKDTYGNYIEFVYREHNREILIDEIKYTGNTNTGLNPYAKLKFLYNQRSDNNLIFISGSHLRSNVLLKEIEVTITSKLFRRYEFEYGYDLRSYLTTVKEYDADNRLLNPTIFKYGNKGQDFQVNTSGVISGQSVDVIPLDFNGDGYTDLFAASYNYTPNTNLIKDYYNFTWYQNNKAGAFTTSYNINVQGLTVIGDPAEGEVFPNFMNFASADYNGNGQDDVVVPKTFDDGTYTRVDKIKIFLDGTSNTLNPGTHNGYNIIHPSQKFLYLGDFDGDGAMDYLTHLSNASTYKTFISFPRHLTFNYSVFGLNASIINSDNVFVLDFDGDGKMELGIVENANCKIFTFRRSGTTQVTADLLYSGGYPTQWHNLYFGDFNGDGKVDLLNRSNGSSQWRIGYSTGKDFHEENIPYNFNNAIFQPHYCKLKIGDYNGDGKSDIMYACYSPNNNNTNITIYYSTGGNSFTVNNFVYNNRLIHSLSSMAQVMGDFNGDGKTDMLNRRHFLLPVDFLYFNPNGQNHLLEKVKDGFNRVTNFSYHLLSSNANYTKGSSAYYPLEDFQKPVYVVNSLGIPNGVGGQNASVYSYEEAIFHKEGKGLLGFKKINVNNSSLNVRNVNEFDLLFVEGTFQNLNYSYTNLLKLKKTYRLSDNLLLRRITNLNSVKTFGPKIFLPLVDETKDENFLTGKIVNTEYTYDNIGRNTKIETDLGGIEDKEVTNTFWTGSEWWKQFKVINRSISNQRAGESLFEQKFKFSYNNQGALFVESLNDGDPKGYHRVYHYNPLGNVKDIQILAFDVPGYRITEFEYDIKGRYPIKITNALGQSESLNYDIVFAQPNRVTSINGLDSYYEYDGLGRMKESINPNGITATYKYDWDINPSDQTIYYAQVNEPGKPSSKIWYDRLDRQVKSYMQGFNQDIYTRKRFNSKGRIFQEYLPHFMGSNPEIITYNYNAFNRVSSRSNSIGTTSFLYTDNGGETTIKTTNPAGYISHQTIDASGKTIEIIDNGGTLKYDYFSSGNQREVTLNGLVVTSIQEDFFGHRTKLIDKNAGTTEYEYNSYGELVFQKDARNNEFAFGYDVLGRQISRTNNAGGGTTYEYYNSGHGVNQIKKVTAPNGIIQEYKYDHLDRLKTSNEIIDNLNFTQTFQYDNYNNLTELTYPSGFKIKKSYDSKGYLTEIKDVTSNTTIFTHLEENAFRQPTKYILGNGVTTEKFYNTYGFPTRFKAGAIQDLKLDFELTTGNLLSREDVIKGQIENFDYDNLNRLIESHVAGSTPKTISYTANGNITHKSDLGSYSYDANKVNAVSSINLIGGLVYNGTENITYNHFNKATTISKGAFSREFTYGADFARKKFVQSFQGNNNLTRYYIPGYERSITTGLTQEVHYIPCNDGLGAIYVKANGVGSIYYVYKDHLESPVTVTDASGAVVAEQSFDAWGRSRNPNNWNSNVANTPSWLYRGFTGHEKILGSTLINMNGRIYDPIVARVLSPDRFVQNPLSSQSYNRYSYVFNNPLSYTDPSGDVAWFVPVIIGAAVGSYVGGSIQQGTGMFWNWDNNFYKQGDFWKSTFVGAVVGAGVGATFGAGIGAKGTGLGIGFSTKAKAASSLSWNIASEALITANINIASSYLQGGGLDEAFTNGAIGLGAGAIGGLAGGLQHPSLHTGAWESSAIRSQSMITSSLNGFGTRVASSYAEGQSGINPWINGLRGAAEGAYLGYISSGSRISNIGTFQKGGRYISSILAQGGTSIPGLGFSMGYFHLKYMEVTRLPESTSGIAAPVLPIWTLNLMANIFPGYINGRISGLLYDDNQFYNQFIIGNNYPAFVRPDGGWPFLRFN